MSDADEPTKRYEGYTDYQSTSNRIGRSIDEAVDAYAAIDSLHAEGARVRPQRAAEARRYILAAALKLVPELEANRNGKDDDIYGEILDRWIGDGEAANGDGDEEPFIDRLRDVSLQTECPDWLYQLVADIRKAGWEVGYLQAGRTVTERELDRDEAEARAMFD